jgi:hypothetical protein
MKIKIGVRGSSDSINHILIKIDDLTLMTTENLFLAGEEYRAKTGQNIVGLLNTLSKDHTISIRNNLVKELETELKIKNGELEKYSE